jgi:hypothetical protein
MRVVLYYSICVRYNSNLQTVVRVPLAVRKVIWQLSPYFTIKFEILIIITYSDTVHPNGLAFQVNLL